VGTRSLDNFIAERFVICLLLEQPLHRVAEGSGQVLALPFLDAIPPSQLARAVGKYILMADRLVKLFPQTLQKEELCRRWCCRAYASVIDPEITVLALKADVLKYLAQAPVQELAIQVGPV
jgi:hypothetical protein